MSVDINKTYELYDKKIIKGWEDLYKLKRKKLFNLLKAYYTGSFALEMGCGDGESTKHLLKEFKQLDVVDGVKKALIDLKNNFSKINIYHHMFGDFEPQKKYDTIFMTHILEHIDEPYKLLNKVYNWLNDKGRVLISVPNALSIHRLIGVKMGLLMTPYDLNDQDTMLGHKRIFDKDSMEKIIEKTNFRILHFTGLMFKPLDNRHIEKYWSKEQIEAFFQLGFDFPEYCSEIIFILEK